MDGHSNGPKGPCGDASRRTVLAGVASLFVTSCSQPSLRTSAFSYRMRVGVIVGGERHVADSVLRVEWRDTRLPGLPHGGVDYQPRVWGEAVALDLGEKDVLFALLTGVSVSSGYPATGATRLLHNQVKTLHPEAAGLDFFDRIREVRDTFNLPTADQPVFVRFRDIHDLTSVERVDGGNFEALYGPGSALEPVTVQVTDDESQKKLVKIAPAVGEFAAKRPPVSLSGSAIARTNTTLADRLTGLDFSRSGE